MISHVTWQGPEIDDLGLLELLPSNLAGLLRQINGYVQFHGGLHIRGACANPYWHSLREAWHGLACFSKLYPDEIHANDIPFGENSLGDQYFLRERSVYLLRAETGIVESLNIGLGSFLSLVEKDPLSTLNLQPLVNFQENGGALQPGELLATFPPLCTKQAETGVSFAAVTAIERRKYLSSLAAFVNKMPPGAAFDMSIEN